MGSGTRDRCARCGFSAKTDLQAPFEWEWYLMAERGADLPTEGVTIPLCRSCFPRAAALQEAFFQLDDYADAEQDAIYEDAYDLLDDLDLVTVVGPSNAPSDVDGKARRV